MENTPDTSISWLLEYWWALSLDVELETSLQLCFTSRLVTGLISCHANAFVVTGFHISNPIVADIDLTFSAKKMLKLPTHLPLHNQNLNS